MAERTARYLEASRYICICPPWEVKIGDVTSANLCRVLCDARRRDTHESILVGVESRELYESINEGDALLDALATEALTRASMHTSLYKYQPMMRVVQPGENGSKRTRYNRPRMSCSLRLMDGTPIHKAACAHQGGTVAFSEAQASSSKIEASDGIPTMRKHNKVACTAVVHYLYISDSGAITPRVCVDRNNLVALDDADMVCARMSLKNTHANTSTFCEVNF